MFRQIYSIQYYTYKFSQIFQIFIHWNFQKERDRDREKRQWASERDRDRDRERERGQCEQVRKRISKEKDTNRTDMYIYIYIYIYFLTLALIFFTSFFLFCLHLSLSLSQSLSLSHALSWIFIIAQRCMVKSRSNIAICRCLRLSVCLTRQNLAPFKRINRRIYYSFVALPSLWYITMILVRIYVWHGEPFFLSDEHAEQRNIY